MDSSEFIDFAESVAESLKRDWGSPTEAGRADLSKLWSTAVEQGWTEISEVEGLGYLVTLERTLGSAACPLPMADIFILRRLLGEVTISTALAEGKVRAVLIFGDEHLEHVDGAVGANHIAVLHGTELLLHEAATMTLQPGTAIPSWHAVVPGEVVYSAQIPEEEYLWARKVMRLARAARAASAAEHSHRAAIEHAKARRQFGRIIGGFGAVQQRIAGLEIDVAASNQLIDEAVRQEAAQTGDWLLAVDLAAEHVHNTAPSIQAGAQHTLGATGFFDDHVASWLFRRVHADLAHVRALSSGRVADELIVSGRSLPSLDQNEATEDYRGSVRDFIIRNHLGSETKQEFVDIPEVVTAVAEQGLLGAGLPKEFGGEGRDAQDQAVVIEEFGYYRVSAYAALNAVLFLSRAIADHGTPEQKSLYIPMIRDGDLRFCLGYSEPETGSDLASLRTAAEQQGDDWVVNGQKTWTTRANASDWIWLAARTDPNAPRKQAGITVFLLPLDTEGITIHNHTSQAGEISCSVFFDDVKVPDRYRIGAPGNGWAVIKTALAGERTSMGAVTAALHRLLDDFLALAKNNPELQGVEGSSQRATISDLAVRLQAGRVLVRSAIKAIDENSGSGLEAPLAAVAGGELAEFFGNKLVELLGPSALLESDASGSVGSGAFAYHLQQASKSVIGGGTNDILRGIIGRTLGLPRE